jgi:hypothetical protein
MMTSLDEAFLAAQDDPALVDRFYGLFLATTLFVPIYDRSDADPDAPMRPIVIPDGDLQFIPVFDTLDKLVTWAQQEVGYMQMPAHDFLQGLHPNVHLALNPGDELFKEFVPDEIQWLRNWADPHAEKTLASPNFKIEAPKRIPHSLQSRLFEFFNQTSEIKAAYLAKCQYEGKPAGWVLVLEVKGGKNPFENLSKAVSGAVAGTLGSQVTLEILAKRGEGLDLAVTQAVEPFYLRSKFH